MQDMLGFAESTRNGYEQSLSKYSCFHNMSLHKLLEEAEKEEDDGVRMRNRKINNRIFDFKNHLETATYVNPISGKMGKYSPSTINKTIRNVLSFYHAFEVQTPRVRKLAKVQTETYNDIITKDMIRRALKATSNLKQRAVILCLACSGVDVSTLLSLSWSDFVTATEDYHTGGGVKDVLKHLRTVKDPIGMFHAVRQKTNYEFVFFFSPEAIYAVCDYGLSLDGDIYPDSQLIDYRRESVVRLFGRINEKLGFGKNSKGFINKFHAHGLRKYFASSILGCTVDGGMIDSLFIEFMLGHRIPATQEAYFKANPDLLKDVYIGLLPVLAIEDVEVRGVDSPRFKRLEFELKEYKQLDGELNLLREFKSVLDNKQDLVGSKIDELLNDISIDYSWR